MMGRLAGDQGKFFYDFDLGEQVPADHLLRRIDAPESAQQCQRHGRPWACGREASLALSSLIGSKMVRCEQRDTDRSGRVVAVCSAWATDLGAWLVRRGYALADRRQSLDYVDEEDAARTDGAGIWAGEFVKPWEWRRH